MRMEKAANTPNEAMGMMSDIAVVKKATAVVNEVAKTAWAVCLYVYFIRASRGISDACRQASMKTKMSSAP